MPNNRNFVPITAAELRQAEQNTQAMLQNATAWVFNGTYTVDARNEGQEVVPCVPKDDFAKSLTPEQRGEMPANEPPRPEQRLRDRERARLIDQGFAPGRDIAGNQGA